MNDSPDRILKVGTRTSRLARWQAERVVQLLQDAWPDLKCELRPFVTKGDKTLDKPLPEIGGKGLFTAELERALRKGEIDVAVHSLKDLPVEEAPGLIIGAITDRANAQDGLVARHGHTLSTLPAGSVVGTSSLRRQAQLLAQRPDLQVRSIRGNVGTRVRKALEGEYDAAVLAAAGLERLDLTDVVSEWLPPTVMLPAPGQAALAVQCRAGDERVLELLAAIESEGARRTTAAERRFLQALGGGCSAPIAAYATVEAAGRLRLRGLIATPDGQRVIKVESESEGADLEAALALGERLAHEATAQGATAILAALEPDVSVVKKAPKPLAGQRIVVTRPPHQAPELAERLQKLGATPILFPTIQIRPMEDSSKLDEAIGDLGRYDWVIFTSVNGVAIFFERVEALGLDNSLFDGVRVAAIGPATGDALAEEGVAPDYIPEEFVAERIAEGLGDVSGLSILLPRAAIARETLRQMLAAQGAAVDEIPTYRTLPATPSSGALAALENVDIITFTSSSTVRNFIDLVGGRQEALRLLQDATVACIGPITAGTVEEELSLRPGIVADEYTMDGLVTAIAGREAEDG
ncbi:MAG: hydroxymethylbilane synthase [Candidatus Promineifilaceae bacterium]|nr:hydroxymethylbilane synthase [Candidatus Promineifilaceae bacterium]